MADLTRAQAIINAVQATSEILAKEDRSVPPAEVAQAAKAAAESAIRNLPTK